MTLPIKIPEAIRASVLEEAFSLIWCHAVQRSSFTQNTLHIEYTFSLILAILQGLARTQLLYPLAT